MILAISAQVMTVLLRWYPLFWVEVVLYEPNTVLRALKASFVKTTNLPRWPPGASWRTLSLLTWQESTPGRFLAACLTFEESSPYTKSGPFLITYLEFLYLPVPYLIYLDFLTLARSSPAPSFTRVDRRDLVLASLVSMTRGNSGTLSTLCPLAITRGVQAEAASAEATACLLWVTLHFWCHFLQILRGANILAFLHMLPKVA